jgi:hypothetical protein
MAQTTTTKQKPHKIIVVLGLPPRIADFIIRATAIASALAANSKVFPSPPVALTVLTSHIDDLTAKEAVAQTRVKGAAANRDAARKQVVVDLGQLQGYVQQVVNADPANAESLAAEAGMSVRKKTNPAKPPLAAKNPSTGSVQLVAKAISGAKTNDWQYSTDGGKTWVSATSTTKAKTTITGLVPGSTVSVRHRPITKAGPADWGQDVSAIVI